MTFDPAAIVARIKAGDESAEAELYRTVNRGMRYIAASRVGAGHVDDIVHDTFMATLASIRNDEIRQPECLMGFVRTILHRRIVLHIDTQVRERRTKVSIDDMVRLGYRVADKVSQQREYARFVVDEKRNQERNAILRERMEVVKAALAQLDEDEREILERFYLQEQSPEEIMREMHLTATQFRLHKSRAKAKFGQIGRMQMARESLKRRVG